ncbi:hypothetical protein CLV63_12575 [Murinocardiopsis flavida]|uniref:AEC family transporter n=1 Tax=Murinocardiopsis flavida TaxID=645275 RepID=A0A2P8CXH4_9ACTN|nr:AEC family transporter [Murinocardiopsis flavida]PSK89681.1 hypothetical protein CLV63_12575 [Murinocardiopsis flavida]
MTGVITGFGVIAAIIAVGYIVGRSGVLGEHGHTVLTRLAFNVATPALLFHILAGADLAVLVSPTSLITALSTVVIGGLFAALGALRRWGLGPTTIGALCACFVNAGNLGIPIAAYVLGDAAIIAPVLLFQMLVTPAVLVLLDVARPGDGGARNLRGIALAPLRNPVVLGSVAGIAVAASGWTVPAPVLEPFVLLGAMAVPAVLLAFGISLHGAGLPATGPERWPVLASAAMKAVLHPLLAWGLGAFAFGLTGAALFTVVVIAALPAAQNIVTFAVTYATGTTLARESILLSTVASAPVLFVVAVLLG